MPKVKPIVTDVKYGVIGFLILATVVIGAIIQWKGFYDFFVTNGILLNWRFVFLIIFFSAFIVWFIMNYFWKKEYEEHEILKKERDNLKDALKSSENQRLTDVITGIPNSSSLIEDIKEYFPVNRPNKKMQFIFIDLKDFRKVNKDFGSIKTNDLLRTIAQTIYKRMRRNEDMYKYSTDDSKSKHVNESFYRVYPGGDEFAFIIEGDQSDALGFSNRLVGQFEQLSNKTQTILGQHVQLSFHCAIVEMYQKDSYTDIFERAEACYRIAELGTSDFTICWHPINIERTLSKDTKKQAEYIRTRKLFEVKTMDDKDDDS